MISIHYELLAQDLYWLWKVLEIDNAIFQDLDSFGKGKFFNLSIEQF